MPFMGQDILLTAEGLEKLKAELADLKGPTRSRIADAIKEAKSHGDLRENAAYHEAKLNQQRLESRISDLERAIQRAKVVERPAGSGDTAHLGSKIVLLDLEFDDEFEITLVGSFEADPHHNLISISSPLGEAVMGQLPGAEIEVEAPGGTQRYRIISIKA
jgi:transcription elongation factor GreA